MYLSFFFFIYGGSANKRESARRRLFFFKELSTMSPSWLTWIWRSCDGIAWHLNTSHLHMVMVVNLLICSEPSPHITGMSIVSYIDGWQQEHWASYSMSPVVPTEEESQLPLHVVMLYMYFDLQPSPVVTYSGSFRVCSLQTSPLFGGSSTTAFAGSEKQISGTVWTHVVLGTWKVHVYCNES